jgi:hypothetical protein
MAKVEDEEGTENAKKTTAEEVGEKRFSYSEEAKRLVLGRQVPLHTKDDDLKYFWAVAEARGLDPLCDYLYGEYEEDPEKDGQSVFKVHPTLAGYRFKAEQTGQYRGTTTPQFCGADGHWTEVWLKEELPAACKVGVRRAEFSEPQYHVVLMKDWEKQMNGSAYWKLSPESSLAARAETGALKKAFPSLGGGVAVEEQVDSKLVQEATQELKRRSGDIPIVGPEAQEKEATREAAPAEGGTQKQAPTAAGGSAQNGECKGAREQVSFDGVAFDAEIPYEKKELKGSTFGTIKSAQFQSLARKFAASNLEDKSRWKAALRSVLSELVTVGDALKGTALVAPEETNIAGKEVRLPLDTLRGLRMGKLDLVGVDESLVRKIASESLARLPLGQSEIFLGEYRGEKREEPEEGGKKNGKGVGCLSV